MDLIENLKQKITGKDIKIVFPEVSDERIIEAVEELGNENVIKPVLIAVESEIRKQFPSKKFKNCLFMHPSCYDKLDEMVAAFVERRNGKATVEQAKEMVENANYFGTMLVYMGVADGFVSGATHSTGDTVRPALQLIKTKPNISKTFGYFIMLRNDEQYIMGDCAINPNPTAQELAEFAVESANVAKVFGMDPHVALLSFSTNGSAKTPEVEKVVEATKIAQKLAPEHKIDGEMQFDAAFVQSVGQKKYPNSKVAGKANTFVFPDLNSGNIGYKMAQRLGGFDAVGPILAGLNKPVNDLSRGCTVVDIYKTAIITAAQTLM